jgi:hypothetical protein
MTPKRKRGPRGDEHSVLVQLLSEVFAKDAEYLAHMPDEQGERPVVAPRRPATEENVNEKLSARLQELLGPPIPLPGEDLLGPPFPGAAPEEGRAEKPDGPLPSSSVLVDIDDLVHEINTYLANTPLIAQAVPMGGSSNFNVLEPKGANCRVVDGRVVVEIPLVGPRPPLQIPAPELLGELLATGRLAERLKVTWQWDNITADGDEQVQVQVMNDPIAGWLAHADIGPVEGKELKVWFMLADEEEA